MRNDIFHAVRALRRTPAFTLLAIGSLAVGIGASTAVFSLVNAVYFRSLPFHPAGELVVIELFDKREGAWQAEMTPGELGDWATSLGALDVLAAIDFYPAIVSDRTGTTMGEGAAVSANFLPLLGVRPSLGRMLDSADNRPSAENVVLLSDAFWRSRYGADSAVVGHELTLRDTPFQIVGVLPPSAAVGRPLFAGDSATAQFFVPIGPYTARTPGSRHTYTLLGRLRSGIRLETLHIQVALLLARSRRDLDARTGAPRSGAPWTASVLPLREAHARAVVSAPYVLFLGTVAVVLLIVCANLAGLFLARFHTQRQGMLIRAALGAQTWDLVRQFSLEGLLCAVTGAALGVALAAWGLALTRFLPPRGIPYWTHFTVDGRVLVLAACLSVLSAAIIGVAPALAVSPRGTDLSLRAMSAALGSGRGVGRHRSILIALEMQLALVLLTGAGLLGNAFLRTATRDLGIARRSVLGGWLAPRRGGQEQMSPAEQRTLAERLLERLQVLPGAVYASIHASDLSFPGLTREGDTHMIPTTPPLRAEAVTPDYFRADGIALIQGRTFSSTDATDAPAVVVIDDETAQHLFPEGHVLGRRIKLGDPASASPWMVIVGIVAATRDLFRNQPHRFSPGLYRPFAQSSPPVAGLGFTIRTRGPAEAMIPSVRAALGEVAPNVPLLVLMSRERQLDEFLTPLRWNAAVLGSFAVISLIIAALGVSGVVAQLVAKRSAEAGLRMALGAPPRRVLWLMMRSTILAALVGITGGIVGSLALTRVVRAFLYGESSTDPRVFAGATLVLAATAAAAAYFPARRATRADPAIALRNE
jgi:putative ABC transport system permease protein